MNSPAKRKQAYLQLVENVRTIDPEAAEYMVLCAPHLNRFAFYGDLPSAFMWSDTPQGYTYWSELNKKLAKNGWFENDY